MINGEITKYAKFILYQIFCGVTYLITSRGGFAGLSFEIPCDSSQFFANRLSSLEISLYLDSRRPANLFQRFLERHSFPGMKGEGWIGKSIVESNRMHSTGKRNFVELKLIYYSILLFFEKGFVRKNVKGFISSNNNFVVITMPTKLNWNKINFWKEIEGEKLGEKIVRIT